MLKTRHNAWILCLCIALAMACAKDPSKDAPAAQVNEPSENTEAKAPAAEEKAKDAPAAAKAPRVKAEKAPAAVPANAPDKAKDILASRVQLSGTLAFEGSKVTGSHRCIFKNWTGYVFPGAGRGGQIESMALFVKARIESTYCDPDNRSQWTEKLDKHLIGEDFFKAAEFPEAIFKSSRITKAAEGDDAYTVVGQLTMRGVTKEVTFPATISVADKTLSGKAKFSINRKDFNIVYAGKPDDLIQDKVVLTIKLSAAKG